MVPGQGRVHPWERKTVDEFEQLLKQYGVAVRGASNDLQRMAKKWSRRKNIHFAICVCLGVQHDDDATYEEVEAETRGIGDDAKISFDPKYDTDRADAEYRMKKVFQILEKESGLFFMVAAIDEKKDKTREFRFDMLDEVSSADLLKALPQMPNWGLYVTGGEDEEEEEEEVRWG